MHPDAKQHLDNVTLDSSLLDAVVEGVCTACGDVGAVVEPDAMNYECECCGEAAVSSPLVLLHLI